MSNGEFLAPQFPLPLFEKTKVSIRNVLSVDLFIHLFMSVWTQSPVLLNKLSVAFIIHFDVQTILVLVIGHPFKLDSVSS